MFHTWQRKQEFLKYGEQTVSTAVLILASIFLIVAAFKPRWIKLCWA